MYSQNLYQIGQLYVMIRIHLGLISLYKTESNGKTENDYLKLHTAINDVSEIINKNKNYQNFHLGSKLNNPKTSAKTFYRRNHTPITDFKQKADLFNDSFAWQCTTIVNSSGFITDTQSYKTSSRLPSLSSENDDILK